MIETISSNISMFRNDDGYWLSRCYVEEYKIHNYVQKVRDLYQLARVGYRKLPEHGYILCMSFDSEADEAIFILKESK